MIKGFRDFILRGNVIDLAVAVVIGGAFTLLVNAVVSGLIDPIVKKVIGGNEVAGTVSLFGVNFDIGLVITAAITFLVTAAVVYFVFVAPMNHAKAKRAAKLGEPEAEEVPDDVALLREIRDLLAQQRGSAGDGKA